MENEEFTYNNKQFEKKQDLKLKFAPKSLNNIVNYTNYANYCNPILDLNNIFSYSRNIKENIQNNNQNNSYCPNQFYLGYLPPLPINPSPFAPINNNF